MKQLHDIDDNEIRVVGGEDGRKRTPWWVWVSIGVAIVAVVLFFVLHRKPSEPTDEGSSSNPQSATLNSQSGNDIWFDNTDKSSDAYVHVADTIIDSLHLTILTPYNAVPELHVGRLDTTNTDIILAAMAADLRRDNGKIVGAFVYAGEPLSWGLSKKGYCAIIDGRITLGTADNSPLFEQATEQGGYFFRQYAAVAGGTRVENRPENAAFRRALCLLNGKVCIVNCPDRVVMNDFGAALVKLGVSEAIFLVGGTANSWYRSADGQFVRLGASWGQNAKYMNHIVFRKQ